MLALAEYLFQKFDDETKNPWDFLYELFFLERWSHIENIFLEKEIALISFLLKRKKSNPFLYLQARKRKTQTLLEDGKPIWINIR